MQNKAGIAGILTIISGIIGVLWLGYAFFLNYFFEVMSKYASTSKLPGFASNMYGAMSVLYIGWGSLTAALGIFAIVAGIFALNRRNWALALAGAIAGTITFFPCGIPAIILISWAQNEFPVNKPSSAAKH